MSTSDQLSDQLTDRRAALATLNEALREVEALIAVETPSRDDCWGAMFQQALEHEYSAYNAYINSTLRVVDSTEPRVSVAEGGTSRPTNIGERSAETRRIVRARAMITVADAFVAEAERDLNRLLSQDLATRDKNWKTELESAKRYLKRASAYQRRVLNSIRTEQGAVFPASTQYTSR
jgi:hypothetical protein